MTPAGDSRPIPDGERFVAALGLINIDLLYSDTPRVPTEGEEVFSAGFDLQFGGGPPATLINLRRLGVSVRLGTYLADDLLSAFARRRLDEAGLEYVNFYRGDAVPLTITSIISTERDRTMVSYRPREEEFSLSEAQVYELYRGSSIAYISLGYDDVWRCLKKEGTVLVLDSHWREDLSLALYEEAFSYIDYFTPNEKEAAAITGEQDPAAALCLLADRTANPVVKIGELGCLFIEDGVVRAAPAFASFEKRDSTGAGDAFLAGFIYGLHRGKSLSEAVRLGNLTGGKCVSGIGCLSESFDERELLERLAGGDAVATDHSTPDGIREADDASIA